MIKFRGYILILVFLLTACTQAPVVPKEQEKSEENIVTTPDGKITFEVINNIQIPQEKVETIKEEILAAYEVIKNSIHTTYVPSDRIQIFLNEGNQNSWGFAKEILLYDIKDDRYPLVHEMTHSILGYGNNFDTSSGYFTQEGFADYMEQKYGNTTIHSHQIMKHFIDSNKLIPISKLIDTNYAHSYFRPKFTNEYEKNALMKMSYIHSSSFISYLIDTYGIEKFEQIYNDKDLAKKIDEVYGKHIDVLEKEWIALINNQTDLTTNEKLIMDLYNFVSVIDKIDPKYFTKE
ncbi:hypothetical protein ACIP9G_02170 [Lysinibacillus sp. NPDC093197]|uniref:hypothetical protein n=1 Tax=Lysinibacillus sp. NPDC093197 TaxID=3364132 RepID=UPI00382A80F1